ncbi:MAG TPA: hypothetical protein ENI87_11200 [bacterium]|nr:hypothetical protein [bacterium]
MPRWLPAIAVLVTGVASTAQGDAAPTDRERVIGAAIDAWLAGDQLAEDELEAVLDVVLAAPKTGMRVLGARLRAATPPKGLRTLAQKVVLDFLRRTRASDMVFVGQYDALGELQPFASEFLYELLLETPTWFPFTARVQVVPALRDLEKRLPRADRLDAIEALIEDDREPLDLRRAMAAMMWQWGKREHAQGVIRELRAQTVEGDAEDRVAATLELADYYNLLRDYRAAAGAHRAAQALAHSAGVELRPVSWYAAACVHALNGDRERGMAALDRCARMLASPNLDKSLRLERTLFEKDPEIALLRADERFPKLLELAFGKPSKGDRAERRE